MPEWSLLGRGVGPAERGSRRRGFRRFGSGRGGAAAIVCSGLALSTSAAASQPLDHGGAGSGDVTASRAESSDKRSLSAEAMGDAPARRMRSFGLMFDLGTLEGGMMSLVYRPTSWLRVHGGGGTNGASPGVRAGATVSPFRRGLGLSLEGGHFFPGDINGVFAAFAGSGYDDSHLLRDFDYDFVNLQVGWEIERGDLMFFVRGGVGYLWSEVPAAGLARVENLSSLVDSDGSVELFMPSLKLGFIGFL